MSLGSRYYCRCNNHWSRKETRSFKVPSTA